MSSPRTYPKTWGTPCVYCGYRWCYHGNACIARVMRAENRKRKAIKEANRVKAKNERLERERIKREAVTYEI